MPVASDTVALANESDDLRIPFWSWLPTVFDGLLYRMLCRNHEAHKQRCLRCSGFLAQYAEIYQMIPGAPTRSEASLLV